MSEKPMDKAIKMGKTSATGSFQLFIGKSTSTIMLAIASIIIGIFIAEGEYGLYVIALVPAVTFSIFQDWGISPALTMYCANYRVKGLKEELRNIIVAGLTFGTITGLILSIFSLLTANFVAVTIFGKPEAAFLIILASITILSGGISNSAISVFVGFERMKLGTIVHIVSAIAQSLLSSLLVYLGFGAFGAVIGFTIGSIASGVTALLLLYFIIIRKLPSGSSTSD
jgi:O-antigen/teichoic acid export membrane protein